MRTYRFDQGNAAPRYLPGGYFATFARDGADERTLGAITPTWRYYTETSDEACAMLAGALPSEL